MSIQIYKPNSKNAGSAFTFSSSLDKNSSEPVFYISAIAQYSWNEDKKTGSFSGNSKNPEKTINVKITPFEAGEFISAFNDRRDYNTFHSYGGSNTTIKFSPWDKNSKISKYNPSSKSFEDQPIVLPCFGVTLSKGKSNSIKIALEPGEVEVIKILLQNFLSSYVSFKSQNQNTFKPTENTNQENSEEDSEEAPF